MAKGAKAEDLDSPYEPLVGRQVRVKTTYGIVTGTLVSVRKRALLVEVPGQVGERGIFMQQVKGVEPVNPVSAEERLQVLEQALFAIATRVYNQPMTFGDVAGHEFHGNQYSNGGGAIREGHEVTVLGSRGSFLVKDANSEPRRPAPPGHIGPGTGRVVVGRRDPVGGVKPGTEMGVAARDITGRVHTAEAGSMVHDDAVNGTGKYTHPGDQVRVVDQDGKATGTVKIPSASFNASAAERLEFYSEDQMRDAHGRFGNGGAAKEFKGTPGSREDLANARKTAAMRGYHVGNLQGESGLLGKSVEIHYTPHGETSGGHNGRPAYGRWVGNATVYNAKAGGGISGQDRGGNLRSPVTDWMDAKDAIHPEESFPGTHARSVTEAVHQVIDEHQRQGAPYTEEK